MLCNTYLKELENFLQFSRYEKGFMEKCGIVFRRKAIFLFRI